MKLETRLDESSESRLYRGGWQDADPEAETLFVLKISGGRGDRRQIEKLARKIIRLIRKENFGK